MSKQLGLNIKYLRKVRNLTQDQLADKIGVNRAMIGSYEEGRAVPKLPALQILSHYFNVSIDSLVNFDLSTESNSAGDAQNIDSAGKNLRILTTLVDRDDKELITLVPVKASAGYAKGYSDPDFVETLPKFSLPFTELSKERTYRAFQISGNSMEPIPSGAYIICEYLQNWSDVKSGKTYIVVTKDDGVVYKRLYNNDNDTLLLKSDNPEYNPYTIPLNSISEIWKALGYISFALPEPDEMHLGKLAAMVYKMQTELDELKKK
ncbi:MAG TPA: LexA family transcriptional regulator [Tenuifilaceae bacterium]|nr:LexA family transcriptional regulator [Tenuifilaceae bacterium]HPN20838.1 LexA family transcriptional regulator [Tenuifilaceae bacterium]